MYMYVVGTPQHPLLVHTHLYPQRFKYRYQAEGAAENLLIMV